MPLDSHGILALYKAPNFRSQKNPVSPKDILRLPTEIYLKIVVMENKKSCQEHTSAHLWVSETAQLAILLHSKDRRCATYIETILVEALTTTQDFSLGPTYILIS